MSKYFTIDGYWIDNKESFSGYIVKEFDNASEDDDNVFFYGMSEKDLQDAIQAKEDTTLDFVITRYEQI
jgi:hypothetical protein